MKVIFSNNIHKYTYFNILRNTTYHSHLFRFHLILSLLIHYAKNALYQIITYHLEGEKGRMPQQSASCRRRHAALLSGGSGDGIREQPPVAHSAETPMVSCEDHAW